MGRKVILTKDGSHSVETTEGITYHSMFGAVQESRHVFIDAGLRHVQGGAAGDDAGLRHVQGGMASNDAGLRHVQGGMASNEIGPKHVQGGGGALVPANAGGMTGAVDEEARVSAIGGGAAAVSTHAGGVVDALVHATSADEASGISAGGEMRGLLTIFEMGFGTGLNALLTLMAANRPVFYETIENNPLSLEEVRSLNYCAMLGRLDLQPVFERMHSADWGSTTEIATGFHLHKIKADGRQLVLSRAADLVYYDAFDPVVQPELWTEAVFERLYAGMKTGAVMVTYCCKGVVRRALQAVGFVTEKLPGPPGKREILRAVKPRISDRR